MMAYFVHRNLHFKSSRAAYIDVTLWKQAMSKSARSPALTAARHPISIMSLFFVVWVEIRKPLISSKGIWAFICWVLWLWEDRRCRWCSLFYSYSCQNRDQLFCSGLYNNKFILQPNSRCTETLSIVSRRYCPSHHLKAKRLHLKVFHLQKDLPSTRICLRGAMKR